MRPPGVTGALVAITVGAILTFAVTFTISGISIHTVGLIITLAGLTALAIRLARSVTGLRKRDESRHIRPPHRPNAAAGFPRDPVRAASPTAMPRVSSNVRVDEPHSAVTYRTRRVSQR